MDSFRRCREAGVWGIELDLQWTRDDLPVVLHDTDTRRVLGRAADVRTTDRASLLRSCPEVPALEQVVEAFGVGTHLMIELKAQTFRRRHVVVLRECLDGLEAVRDYHFLALRPAVFEWLDGWPRETFLPVAETNVSELLELTLQRGYGGLTGHYLLLTRAVRQALRQRGMKWGTGFIASRNALLRELSMGTHWLFSDHAVNMQRYLSQMETQPSSP